MEKSWSYIKKALSFILGKKEEPEEKIFLDRDGDYVEYSRVKEKRKCGRFPLCLSVFYAQSAPEASHDFILNASRGGVFVRTDDPKPVGTRLSLHFYIPEDGSEMVLTELRGEVVDINLNGASSYPRGMHIKFIENPGEKIERLVDYLEEKRHLVDESV